MKRHIIFFLFLSIQVAFAQQEYMDVIAQKSCACMQKLKDSTKVKDVSFDTKSGICMIEASMPYQKQLKKDHNINLAKLDEAAGERLGQLVALNMMQKCPDLLIYLTEGDDSEKSTEQKNVNTLQAAGEIVRITDDIFVCFVVDERNGKLSNYYWMEPFPNSKKLINSYKNKLGKIVEITYTERECFDPRITEYKRLKIITGFNER